MQSFRAIAIVGVVASHLDLTWPRGSLTGAFVRSLVQNASVMFLLVAGFLFQHLSRRFSYRQYLRSKLRNVIAPYVVCSLPALLYQLKHHTGIFGPSYGGARFSNPLVQAASALAVAGHMPAPMWFVPAISIIYLAAPLLMAIDRQPRLYWLLPPWLLVAMLCHRPLPVNHLGQAIIYFTPAYLTGMWLSHYRERALRFIDANLGALFASFVALELINVVVLRRSGALFSHTPFSLEGGLFDLSLPSKVLLSFALIGLLARHQAAIAGRLSYLADASFGVFFVHEYLIENLQWLAMKRLHHEIAPSLALELALVVFYTIASLGVVALVRALAGPRSRYLIGC